MQVHGALGMSDDVPLAAQWRQGRWLRIADGPDEVHKMVIALRELNRFKPREPVEAPPERAADPRAGRVRRGDPRLRGARALRAPEDGHSDEVAARMGELGWYGLQIPEQYGGSGGSFLDATLFLEETARGRIPVNAYGVTLIVVGALNRFGTEEQKSRPVRPGGPGRHARDRDVGAGGRVGRGGAEDARPRENGSWVLDGAKMWCSYAHRASHILIVCRTGAPASATRTCR